MTLSDVDWEQLDMISDGFEPDFVEIYREYIAGIPGLLSDLRKALQENDAPIAARVAHQIKGSSANFGFAGVSVPAATLEQSAKQGQLADGPTLVDTAESAFARAVAEVAARHNV